MIKDQNRNPTNVQLPAKRISIWNPLSDFWMLGGLSILLLVVMRLGNLFREDLFVLQVRFMQLGAVFSILSLICNYPHFMVSYRFGYGRGSKFIFKNWIALIAVPALLIGAYAAAFFYYDTDISDSAFLPRLNEWIGTLGLRFQFGQARKLGEEILGLSIWLMYLSVGWHYCKQVYGSMMVYAFYDGYKLGQWQKQIFKWSAVSVALFQFVNMSNGIDQSSPDGSIQDPRFQGVHLSSIGLPTWSFSASVVMLSLFAFLGLATIAQVYRKTKKWPSINFLVPWIAFYIWWVPIGQLPEYYFMMVPFFHSLQYLPFALRLENGNLGRSKHQNVQTSLRILLLLLIGILSFELIPAVLDKSLDTDIHQTAWFFTIAFAVFINIHHFFIDSVVWRFKDNEVKAHLLYEKVTPRESLAVVA